jgi:hypothetical protein
MVCKMIHNRVKENKSENNFEFNLCEMSLFERLFIMLNNLFHVFNKTIIILGNTHPKSISE